MTRSKWLRGILYFVFFLMVLPVLWDSNLTPVSKMVFSALSTAGFAGLWKELEDRFRKNNEKQR